MNDFLGIKVKPSNLVIDGGNIVKHNDILLLTDKILIANRAHTKESIIYQIKADFEVSKVILIPRDEKCDYGHADGMLRFIDNKTVLISDFYAYLGNTLTKPLLDAGLSIEWLKTGGKSLGGDEVAYINFLQTKDVLLIPQLGKKPQDAFAIEQLQSYFPYYKVKGINTKMITKHFGGALNCMSWTVLE